MLKEVAKVSTCSPHDKYVLLMLDIRVYDKHSGALIGFANLGEINSALLAYERSLQSSPSH